MTLIGTISLVNSPLIAGEEGKTLTTVGTVKDYKANEKIVIVTASAGEKEFKITKTTLVEAVKQGSSVTIETKTTSTSTATTIRQVSDVAGPDYNPTPVKQK
jgi:hypothetical protein